MREKRRQAVADEALAHELVPVAVGAERRLRVVDVEHPDAIESHPGVEIIGMASIGSPVKAEVRIRSMTE